MPETLGERLKQARQALGLTQKELGKPDLSKSFISLLERNLTRPSVATLERLAQRLRKPVSYLLAGDPQTAISQKVLDVLTRCGWSELARQNYGAALAAFEQMCELAAARGDARTETYAVLGRGEALVGLRRLDEAKPHLDDAMGRAREAKDAFVECRALHGLATVELRGANFPQARSLYERALTIVATLSGEEALHGEILLFYGTALHRMGRLEEASEAFTQAQQIFEDAKLPERVGEALVDHGLVLYLSGDYDAALLRLERARVLLEQHEDLRTLSWARNNLGMVLLEIGRPHEALEHFSISLAIKQRLQDAVWEGHTLTELARCHFACGEMERARDYAEQSITRSRNGGAPDEVPRAQIVLGAIAIAEGNARKAQRYLTLAAAHCERASMTLELVTVFRELARVASLQGRHKEASTHHEKAFAVLRTMAPHDAAAALRMADVVACHTTAAHVGGLRSPKSAPEVERAGHRASQRRPRA